ncbi:MAG: PQQ-binding-like beta-propeller repeat protein [Bacteroidaceae bacterium]|nr:PQQ-binding-like beta-propeller repeat protein [Bacteroidaceae bacterium]
MRYLFTGLFVSILFYCSAQSQTFKFALMSDLHVTSDSIAENDVRRAVDQINNTPGIDFVIVSGDLSETGDRLSLEKAKSILDGLKPKYYATSGNHETKWSESGATDFGQIFGSDRFRFEHQGILFLGFNTGPVIRMAEGHVAPQDISWLNENLQKAGKEKPVFIVTHYPLMKGDVDNWYEVTDMIRPYNIKVILNGHYHSNRLTEYDGIPAIINRSTLRAGKKYGGYSLYEITSDSIFVYEHLIGEAPRKWGGYSLKQTYYTDDVSSYERPDFTVNTTYPQVKERWTVDTGNALYSSPVLYNNRVYVGDDLGYLRCFRLKDGKKVWQYKTQNRIVGTPAVDENVVVFGSADNNIYGLNAKNGKLLWKSATSRPVLGAVTIEQGIAYIGGSDRIFRAIDIKTGHVVWEFSGLKGYVETKPLLFQDKVIFGAWDSFLYALDKNSGELIWKWQGPRTGMHFSPAAVWPVAAHNKVFIVAPDRVLTAVDAQTGKSVWRTNQSHVREMIGLSADNDKVYCKTMQDSVVCFSTVSDVPKKLWATYVGYGYELMPSMLLEKDNAVFGSTMRGEIFALDSDTGKLLWRHKKSNSLINTVIPLSATECLYTGSAGMVGLLKVEK